MKKLFLIMLAVMCAGVMYGQKRVAVVPPTATEGVTPIDVAIVRGKLVEYISAMRGYEAFTRTDIDQIVDQIIIEMDLYRSGMIKETERKQLGTLKGVNYILVSTLTYGKGRLNVEASLLSVETGKIENAVSQVINPEIPEDMENACKTLAEKLTGVYSTNNNNNINVQNKNNTINFNISKDYVTINGITWAAKNAGASNPEDNGNLYTWKQANTACPSGWRLPTQEELEKLKNAGSVWGTQNGKNGRYFGDNNNMLFLPAAGFRVLGQTQHIGTVGYYWSGAEQTYTLGISSSGVYLNRNVKSYYSVRCVKE